MSLQNEYITVAFYKSDIVMNYEKEGLQMSVIAFPKSSKYAGYVWHYPTFLIKDNDSAKDVPACSFNPDKRWVRFKRTDDVHIIKTSFNEEIKRYQKEDEIILTIGELKEAMKRPYKLANKNVGN